MKASPRHKWYALALLCTVQFMVVLDIAVVNVALPSIQTDLGFSQENLQWVISAYALLFGGFLLLGGRAADLLGRRRVFIVGIVVFSIASLLSGLRVERGLADRRPRAAGPRRGDHLPRRPVDPHDHVRRGPGAQHGARRLGRRRRVRRGRGRPARRDPHRPAELAVDLLRQRPGRRRSPSCSPRCCSTRAATRRRAASTCPGAALVTGGLVTLVYAITQANKYGWGSAETFGFFAAALVLLAGFVAWEARIARPAHAAVDLPAADARRREHRRADPRHRAVRDVPDADALHAAGARLLAAEDRVRLPRRRGHGDRLVGASRRSSSPASA